jgi:membrane-associated HD superfamily phosphohydrolase
MNRMVGMDMFMGMSITWGNNVSWVFDGWKTNDSTEFLLMLLGFWGLLALQMVLKYFRNSKTQSLVPGIVQKMKNSNFWIGIALSLAIYFIQSMSMLLLMSFNGFIIFIFLLMASIENLLLNDNKNGLKPYI